MFFNLGITTLSNIATKLSFSVWGGRPTDMSSAPPPPPTALPVAATVMAATTTTATVTAAGAATRLRRWGRRRRQQRRRQQRQWTQITNCYVLSTLVLIFRCMTRSIMISSFSSSDQLNFTERLESVNRVFHPA
jgi:hypothetical protein